MKLVLILILLIVSLMTVVGAFLMNSVVVFYIRDFYTQMNEVFVQDEDFVRDLVTAVPGETDGARALQRLLNSNMSLGVNGRTRNYYILDGRTGNCLASSSSDGGSGLEDTPNLLTALNDRTEGDASDVTANYMDLALPITRGGTNYIIYIYDNRQMARELNNSLFLLILEALSFGLVISVLLSFLLSKTMITPIERLTEGVRRVAAGDFSRRIEISATDEIGVLTDNFNHMARQLQDTIREVETERNKLDTLFLHMKDGVVAFSRSGAVIHKNPAAEKMLGTEIGPSVTYDGLFRTAAPPLDRVLSLAQNGYLEGERRADGRSLELLLAPFDRDSREGGVMVVIHDVTEQRKAEEMRKEFVANVSHELRTPLTNIRSYAETLAESADLPPEMQQSFLGVILNESDRMAHIVQDLLTLSRFDSGHSELNLSRFSFAAAVRDMYSANLMAAQRHGHTVELTLAPDLPEIVGDRERIIQVMMNIVSNAIKYTPDGGEIRISAGLERTSVWMAVSDNGIGIPPADRARIFERFYRVDKARSRESGGTGLGLSIAKEIMNRHHGTLELVDRPGPGSTLRMTLPVEGPAHD